MPILLLSDKLSQASFGFVLVKELCLAAEKGNKITELHTEL